MEGFVYLDDIPLVAKKPKVRRGARCVARKLVKAGFLISPKSVCEPTQQLDFIGKWFDTEKGCMGNNQGLLVGIPCLCSNNCLPFHFQAVFCPSYMSYMIWCSVSPPSLANLGLWVLAAVGPFEPLLMSHLLGRLEWALRPNAGAAALLASAYKWMQGDFTHVGMPFLRSLMTAIIFAIIPHLLKLDVCPVLPVGGVEDKHVLFCDAAPSADGRRFFMGVYLTSRGFRHWKCPDGSRHYKRQSCLQLCAAFSWLLLWAGRGPILVPIALWCEHKPRLCVPALRCRLSTASCVVSFGSVLGLGLL